MTPANLPKESTPGTPTPGISTALLSTSSAARTKLGLGKPPRFIGLLGKYLKSLKSSGANLVPLESFATLVLHIYMYY